MKKIQSVFVSVAVAIGMAAPASAGSNDPEIIIYRFPGVLDTGEGVLRAWRQVFIARISAVSTRSLGL